MTIDEYVAGLPDAEGRMWHGHPVWMRGNDPVAGFKAFPRWVTLLLWHGADVTESTDALTASADGTRWSRKITGPDDVDELTLDGWLKQLA